MKKETFCSIIKDGKVENIIVVDEESELLNENPEWVFIGENSLGVGIGWSYDGSAFVPPPPPPPPPPRWVISKVAMISRFTSQEYLGVISAAKTDVEVQAWYDLFQATMRVDLKDQRIVDGINLLATKNLLTSERAAEILNTPAGPNE